MTNSDLLNSRGLPRARLLDTGPKARLLDFAPEPRARLLDFTSAPAKVPVPGPEALGGFRHIPRREDIAHARMLMAGFRAAPQAETASDRQLPPHQNPAGLDPVTARRFAPPEPPFAPGYGLNADLGVSPPLDLPSVNDAVRKSAAVRGLPDRAAAEMLDALDIQQRQANRIAEAAVEIPYSGPQALFWPTDHNDEVRDEYGTPRVTGGKPSKHNGYDFRAPMNDPVYSVVDGVVESINRDERSGTYIMIRDAGGNLYGYAHTGAADGITPGTPVQAGNMIGWSNGSGTKDPHTHFTVRLGTPEKPATRATPTTDPGLLFRDLRRAAQS